MGTRSGVGPGWRGLVAAVLALAVALAAGPVAAGAQAATGDRPEAPKPVDRPGTDVVGGAYAPFVPHQALVLPVFGEDVYTCGGSVIHPQWVLTAAHCVDGGGLDGVLVVLGVVDQLQTGDALVVPPSRVTIHSSYSAATKDHDIALLRLPRATRLAPVGVALPADPGPNGGAVYAEGNEYLITGWGRTSQGGQQSQYLRYAWVPTIADGTCASAQVYGSAFHPSTMVCAGLLAGGVDSCQGDSGGPLWDPAANRQVGITSWGIGCAQPNRPGVYTRLAQYEPWLAARVGRPANDAFSQASALACRVGTRVQGTTFATGQAGEPDHAGSAPDSSVWFTLTPPASGTLALTTLGSSYDTTLSVSTGASVGGLVEVAADDDLPGRRQSGLSVPVSAGVTYRIAVDGYARAEGAAQLSWLLDVPGQALFADVPVGHQFAGPIAAVAADAITTGYADCTFRPGADVTRGAMAAFLYRLAGWPTGSWLPPAFADVPSSYDFSREVAWLVDVGITTGYADGTFRPSSPVSRQAVAAFLHRLAGSPAVAIPGPGQRFADVPPTHQFAAAIYWMAASGMTSGYADGTFRPAAPVSRQAMAAFLAAYPG